MTNADAAAWVTVIGAAGTALGIVITKAVQLLRERSKENRKDREDDAKLTAEEKRADAKLKWDSDQKKMADRDRYIERQDRLIADQSAVIKSYRESVDRYAAREARCLRQYAEVRGAYQMVYGVLKMHHDVLVNRGEPVGPMPEFQEFDFEEEDPPKRAEFMARQAEQGDKLVAEAKKRIKGGAKGDEDDTRPDGGR